MDCEHIYYTCHALTRMFERDIEVEDVSRILRGGKIIREYPEGKPYPAFLTLGRVAGKALHVVASIDLCARACHVITAYWPDPRIWDEDFAKRRR